MKRITILSLAMLTFGSVAFAQQQRPAEKEEPSFRMQRPGDKMTEQLGLSTAQKEQVTAIREKYRTEMQTLRNNAALSQDERRTQMKSIMDRQNEEISAILTPEQRTKMEAMKNDKTKGIYKEKGEWKDGKGNKGEWKNKEGKIKGEWKDSTGAKGKISKNNKKAARLKELNLTDAQKSQLQALRQDAQTKTREIKLNTNLTADQKQAQIKSIHQEMKTKQKTILTPEQQKSWDERAVNGRSMKSA